MARYYVNDNEQSNGDHEVHTEECSWLPMVISMKYLGDFTGCRDAVAAAKRVYPKSNGCKWCALPCHTT